MKVQLKRIKTGKNPLSSELDHGFTNGTIQTFPKVGEQLVFLFDRIGKGRWFTTPIAEIRCEDDHQVLITKNSTYILKKGWKQ